MTNALDEAVKLGLDSVQVFTKNQQQWKVRDFTDAEISAWRARVAEMGWQEGRTVSHASYLINLAAPADELWNKSVDLMTVEIERCEALGIPFLVHHPGAFTTSSRPEGLARIVAAYREIFKRTKGFKTISCLENTVGAGSHIGGPFEELAALRATIIEKTGQDERVGFCIDTCHAHAAGYDLSTEKGAAAALEALASTCGMANVRVLHLNDSKGAAGSRRDLHQHIGEGTIGTAGFKAFVNHPGLSGKPMIMETPKGDAKDGTPFDSVNLGRLRKLLGSAKAAARTPAKPAARRTSRSKRTS
jgi:deoxyribonuclease-4